MVLFMSLLLMGYCERVSVICNSLEILKRKKGPEYSIMGKYMRIFNGKFMCPFEDVLTRKFHDSVQWRKNYYPFSMKEPANYAR